MTNKKTFFDRLNKWFYEKGPEDDVVLSSRVRLARNLENAPFPGHAKPDDLKMILETVGQMACQEKPFQDALFFPLADQTRLTRELLKERQLISQELAGSTGDRGLLVDGEGNSPLMINEEDHVRLAVIVPGLKPEKALQQALLLDEALGHRLAWAFHKKWGFLTACPTNCGTGLRVSTRLHLPALHLSGELKPVLEGLQRLGLVARGFYGEGTRSLGEILQISNASTLGRSETEIVQLVLRVTRRIIGHERQSREKILQGKNKVVTEDLIWRALGLLQAARRMSYEETMALLSRVRLGLLLQMDLPVKAPILQHLMVLAQPAHVQKMGGKEFARADRDVYRADMIRKALTV